MAKRRDVYHTMRAHLQKHIKKMPVCPICGNDRWTIEALIAPVIYAQDETGRLVTEGRQGPLVPFVCLTCSFVYHFAWAPIVQQSSDGE
jgi:hypothetical protein